MSRREVSAQLAVAALPAIGVDIAIAIDAVEVGEVDAEDVVAVAWADAQFRYHLVGNDGGFHSHVGQSLGRGGGDHDEGCYGSQKYTFHNPDFLLRVITRFLLQKYDSPLMRPKENP